MAGVNIPIEERHPFLRFDHPTYSDELRQSFETQYAKVARKPILTPSYADFSVFDDVDEGEAANEIKEFMIMQYRQGRRVFNSQVWERLFEINGVMIIEHIQEFFSTFRFANTPVALNAQNTIQFQLGGVPRSMTLAEFAVALGLHTWAEINSPIFQGYFEAGTRERSNRQVLTEYWSTISNEQPLERSPSYSAIREPMKRYVHRLITFSINARHQSRDKVSLRDLWFLHSMDDGPIVNVPYVLAEFLKSDALGPRSSSKLCGGQFVARLAAHFGLYAGGLLAGCTEAPAMKVFDHRSLQKLNVIGRDPTGFFRWVFPIPPAPQDDSDEGEPALPQGPPVVPLPPPRTHGERLDALELSVQGMRQDLNNHQDLLTNTLEIFDDHHAAYELEWQEAAAARQRADRFMDWQAQMMSRQMEHMHLSHTRFDGSHYQYNPPEDMED